MINRYDIAYGLGVGLASPYWLAREKTRNKVFRAFSQRMGQSPRRDPSQPAIMIHAVSLGEINATRALIDQLRKARPNLQFIVSVTTETGFNRGKELYGHAKDVTLVRYPLDFTPAIDRLLGALRPDVVALMELEVWPNFLQQCARREVPVLLINGRMTPKSFRRYRLFRPLLASMFRALQQVCVQEEMYARRFAQIGVPEDRILVTGTMKFDNAPVATHVDGQEDLAAAMGLTGAGRVWVCGSTGPGEEKIVLRVYRKLLEKFPDLRLVIVPRKPERFDEVAQLISAEGFEVLRRSNPQPVSGKAVILGDTMGELRKFYALADVVFVGRSLVDLGHSQHGSDMIEPAALAKPVAIGPYIHNFAEPVRRFLAEEAMMTVLDEKSLEIVLAKLLSDPASAAAMGRRAQDVVRTGQGATRRHVQVILSALDAVLAREEAMTLLDRIERIFRPYAIKNLTLILVVMQGATYLACLSKPELFSRLVLNRDRMMDGEWWRALTIIVAPPFTDPYFAIFSYIIFFIMGTALENQWGVAKYNIYMIVGYIGMLAASLVPGAIVTNEFWIGSVLLAFAVIHPDFQILLFFILPVKVKWIAAAAWFAYIVVLFSGTWAEAAQVGAGVANFLLFFHRDLWHVVRQWKRRTKQNILQAQSRDPSQPFNVCTICGVTEKSNPKMEFRYCPLCKGTPCYCIEHINNHEHR